MKIINVLFIATVFLLLSCATTGSLPTLTGDIARSVDNTKNEFVKLNDGTIVEGDIGKMSLGRIFFVKSGAVIINEKKYTQGEVVAVQKDNQYYRKAVRNDFVLRIVKGKLNVYRKYNNGQGVEGRAIEWYTYYLQKGDKEKIVDFDLHTLQKLISDNSKAVGEYEKYKSLNRKEKRFKGDNYLNNIIRVYNQTNNAQQG